MKKSKLNVVYVLVHMLFWCAYAVSWSYVATYLRECGYESTVVGMVTGIGAVVSVVLQPVLASITAKHKSMNDMKNVIALKCVAVLTAVLVVLPIPGLYGVAIMFGVIAALDASMPSMLSNIAMECVNKGHNVNYGLARGSGSIAYALFCVLLGNMVEVSGANSLMLTYIVTSIATIMAMLYFQRCVKLADASVEVAVKEVADAGEKQNKNMFAEYPFLGYFMVSAVLLFMVHNMLNVFLLNIVESVGGDNSNVGLALAIAAAVELPMMVCFVKVSKHFAIEKILLFSAVFFTMKALVMLLAGNIWVVYVEQFLQVGAFALFTPASVYFINKAMKPEDRGVGQALLGACSLGMGGALGNLIGGMLIDNVGVKIMLVVGVALSVLATGIMIRCARIYRRCTNERTSDSTI